MTEKDARPAVPAAIQRQVLVEAGHRCAIPVCRQVPIELAHIVPWHQCQEHTFENLIALCPTCHTRYDKGDIDRKSMLIYKQNLGLINSRYGDVERRLMHYFADHPNCDGVELGVDIEFSIMYLLKDGLIARGEPSGIYSYGVPMRRAYLITAMGRDFLSRLIHSQEIA